uniref:Mitochondrial pyruvate carrier n=1 Tax=Solanum tuberosum TaxID=4113 RepID=M1CKD1_SOLTU
MSYFRAFLNSPVGPKTTHFWGPMANWGFVISGVMDSQKPPDAISGNMTSGEIVVVFTFLVQTTRTMVDVSFLNAKENVSSRNNGGSSISCEFGQNSALDSNLMYICGKKEKCLS